MWSDDSHSELDDAVARQKIESRKETASVKVWELESDNSDVDSDSSDESDTDESSDSTLNIIDAQLLQDACRRISCRK